MTRDIMVGEWLVLCEVIKTPEDPVTIIEGDEK